jgi:uncharacterized membrane protein YeiH
MLFYFDPVYIDYAAVAVLALTGALIAAKKEMDIFGFILLGTVTGVGGGTIRDTLLDDLPVFWVKDPTYVSICIAASALTFFIAHYFTKSRAMLLLRLDAIGVAAFAVRGAEKAIDAGFLVAVIMGVITATFGGIIRDILSGEIPLILRKEIYVTAAFAGAATYAGLLAAGLEPAFAGFTGFIVALAVRLLALQFNWSLPIYKPKSK